MPRRGQPGFTLIELLVVIAIISLLLAILLAVALGVFRLLVAQIPSYQTELRDWVAAELGFAVGFAVLDARLGFRGPELTLRQATIGSGREFLEAEQATITLDPFALVFSRQIDVSRLTLDGVRLTVERDARGARMQNPVTPTRVDSDRSMFGERPAHSTGTGTGAVGPWFMALLVGLGGLRAWRARRRNRS